MEFKENALKLAEQGDALVTKFSGNGIMQGSKVLENNTLTNKWAADVISFAYEVENEDLKEILIFNAKKAAGNDVGHVSKINGTLNSLADE